MRILFINNDGGGFADHIDIPDGQTVQQLFAARLPHASPRSYLIRVNRQPVTPDQVLQNGDRVSFTPTKVEGAVVRFAKNILAATPGMVGCRRHPGTPC